MTQWIAAYVSAALVFAGLDALWLGFVARRFYHDAFGEMLLQRFNMTAALGFYALYIAGIMFFVVRPALTAGGWKTALLHGLLLGLVAYGTYDLTNLATLKGFPLKVVAPDIAWGMVLTAAAGLAGWAAAGRFN